MNKKQKIGELDKHKIGLSLLSDVNDFFKKRNWIPLAFVVLGVFLTFIFICFLSALINKDGGDAYNWAGPLATTASTIAALWFSTHPYKKPENVIQEHAVRINYFHNIALEKDEIVNIRHLFIITNVGSKTDFLKSIDYQGLELFKDLMITIKPLSTVKIVVDNNGSGLMIKCFEVGKEKAFLTSNRGTRSLSYSFVKAYLDKVKNNEELYTYLKNQLKIEGTFNFNGSHRQIVPLTNFSIVEKGIY